MNAGRLLIDAPLPGPVNMARDEALLQRCTDADAQPVLRFYKWSPPTISLGYFQEYAEFERLAAPAGDLAVVRRTTGGGAILHDLEVTYSIVIPAEHALVKRQPTQLYVLAHEAVIAAIGRGVRMLGSDNAACDSSAQRGPFFCFARRHGLDVVVDNPAGHGGISKIAGSAQRRTKTAILQHGSIMLDSRYTQQPLATWSGLAGKAVDFDQAVDRLRPAFEKSLGMTFELDTWNDAELECSREIEIRYAGSEWTVHRRRGD
jgi:lipoate-protein ligase A